MSTFGGPDDTGVSSTEGLALCEEDELSIFPDWMFLTEGQAGAPGLARRLNPGSRYCAARWNYDVTPRDWLQQNVVIVRNPDNGKEAACRPIDWGPNETTGRVADLSPGMAELLGLTTDDICEMKIPLPPTYEVERYGTICISAGHGLKVRGAAGPPPPSWGLDEVDEARKVVTGIAADLEQRNVKVMTFWDDTSTTQQQNLETICAWHNSKTRDLDVSIHFNAYQVYTTGQKPQGMGTECLYVSQNTLANQLSSAVAACGFLNRGGKKNTGLYFLNHTSMPAVLDEIVFCDAEFDCNLYRQKFDAICAAIATVLSGTVVKPQARKRK